MHLDPKSGGSSRCHHEVCRRRWTPPHTGSPDVPREMENVTTAQGVSQPSSQVLLTPQSDVISESVTIHKAVVGTLTIEASKHPKCPQGEVAF